MTNGESIFTKKEPRRKKGRKGGTKVKGNEERNKGRKKAVKEKQNSGNANKKHRKE